MNHSIPCTGDWKTCPCEACADDRYNQSVIDAEAHNAEKMERPRGEVETECGDLPDSLGVLS